ncbi:glycosyltransferase, partial [Ellagibacter isourolithinifaciens]|uniref:glycosyltransferase n=1 Tax=Ellagibacter isourolithinifaciens TaxID=2137581 RepID=UPI003A94B155
SGDCGVLLASPDGAEVARAVRALADDPDGAAAKGRAIRMLVEGSYSWDETAAKLIEACENSATSGIR